MIFVDARIGKSPSSEPFTQEAPSRTSRPYFLLPIPDPPIVKSQAQWLTTTATAGITTTGEVEVGASAAIEVSYTP